MRNRDTETSVNGKREYDMTAQSKQRRGRGRRKPRERAEQMETEKQEGRGKEAESWRQTRDCHCSAVCTEADTKGWPTFPPLGTTFRPCS